MKNKLIKITAFFALLTQTACITTLHTDPYYAPRSRTVYVSRPRPVFVPVPVARPETVVTVRRY